MSSASTAANLKPLTLSSAPRPLQLQPSASPATPTQPHASLSRSNSTGGRFAGTQESRTAPSPTNSKRPIPKRLSSISYTSSPPSSSSTAASPSSPSSAPLRSAPLARSKRPTSLYIDRASTTDFAPRTTPPCATTDDPGSHESSRSSSTGPAATVLTLAEKHADLLRFIAAKESKCLELRTQLEQHESELLVLKKKWERIVSKSKIRELGGAAAVGPKDTPVGVSGDVVEALKGVGRMLGLSEDTLLSGRSLAPGSPSSVATSSPSPVATSLPSLVDAQPSPSQQNTRSATNTSKTDHWKMSHHKRHLTSRSSSSSPSSTSSPTLSSVPSGRDSLSSISTSSSSLDLPATPSSPGDLTPTGRFDGNTTSPEQTFKDHPLGPTVPWMPAIPVPAGLNKKWEQMQKNSTFEKHSKRASLLLSDVTDMSTSILGSLSSVLLAPTSSSVQPRKLPSTTSSPRPLSLLDEDEEGAVNESLSKPILPSGTPVTRTHPSVPAKSTVTPDDASEEWNW